MSTTVKGRRAAISGMVSGEEARHVALALAQHVAREGVRVDLEERGRALARERERRDLREAARHRGLAGAGGPASTMRPWGSPKASRAGGRARGRGAPGASSRSFTCAGR
jgi:hypothetical protein